MPSDTSLDLFVQTAPSERCEKPFVEDELFQVAPGDSTDIRRRKWNTRARSLWLTPCANQAKHSYDCLRCTHSFLKAINRPEGPWA